MTSMEKTKESKKKRRWYKLSLETSHCTPLSPVLLALGCDPEEFSGGLCKYNIQNNSSQSAMCGLNPVLRSLLRLPVALVNKKQPFMSLLTQVSDQKGKKEANVEDLEIWSVCQTSFLANETPEIGNKACLRAVLRLVLKSMWGCTGPMKQKKRLCLEMV